jgi:hypothetical protein
MAELSDLDGAESVGSSEEAEEEDEEEEQPPPLPSPRSESLRKERTNVFSTIPHQLHSLVNGDGEYPVPASDIL